jgi:hypothetical protein
MSEDGEIARAVRVSRPAAIGWRSRYKQGGQGADELRPGRPP